MERLQAALSLSDRRIPAPLSLRIGLLIVALTVFSQDLEHFVEYDRAYSRGRLLLGLVPWLCLVPSWREPGRPLIAPLPSVRFWIGSVLVLFALSLVFAYPYFAYLEAIDGAYPPSVVRLTGVGEYARVALVQAPVFEELVYRGAICLALWIALGPWPAVLLSGAAFTWLHVAYGNFFPNHIVAGLILSWAFVKSRQLWVAIALHAAGNLLSMVVDLLFL